MAAIFQGVGVGGGGVLIGNSRSSMSFNNDLDVASQSKARFENCRHSVISHISFLFLKQGTRHQHWKYRDISRYIVGQLEWQLYLFPG